MIIARTKFWGNASALPNYDFTGTAPTFLKDNNGNWELVFLTGCTITFNRLDTDVDVFLVGGGNNAGASSNWPGGAQGGAGGKGGGIVNDTITLETGVAYPVVIGGAGQATTAFGKTAAAGAGSNGGAGAVSPGYAAGNGVDGVLAFNTGGTLYEDGTPIKFGAGGGGGAAKGSDSVSKMAAGAGGATGGGAGGSGDSDETDASRAGKANTGGGGGGGSSISGTGQGYYPSPGRGGSGIVIIRNARSNQ